MRKIVQIENVSVYWNSEYKEYVCRMKGNPDADYFTTDKEDAIATAELIVRRANLNSEKSNQDFLPSWSDV